MIRLCDAQVSSEDDMLSLRCMLTIGDALAEVGEWQEGANVYEHFMGRAAEYEKHPLGLHAVAQCAYCHLMAGASDRCREWLRRFPRTSADALSKSVVTIAAELARYLSVEQLCRRKCGQRASNSEQDRATGLVRVVSMIVSNSPSNRVEYLRNLFFAVLARDVESMSEIDK
jgi:hypothetical protein